MGRQRAQRGVQRGMDAGVAAVAPAPPDPPGRGAGDADADQHGAQRRPVRHDGDDLLPRRQRAGCVWQIAAAASSFAHATIASAGVLAQSNAARWGQSDGAGNAFLGPILPVLPARAGAFTDFQSLLGGTLQVDSSHANFNNTYTGAGARFPTWFTPIAWARTPGSIAGGMTGQPPPADRRSRPPATSAAFPALAGGARSAAV